jgi:hypothetical protein
MIMTLRRLQQRLDARGADLSRWPDAERHAAERLIAGDAAAAATLRRARDFDRLITAASMPGDGNAARVTATLARRPLPPQRRRWFSWPVELLDFEFAPAWPRVAALACVGLLGFVIGMSDLVAPIGSDTNPAEIVVAGEPGIGSVLFGPDSFSEAVQ